MFALNGLSKRWTYFSPPSWKRLCLSGKEALPFLNRLSTTALKNLPQAGSVVPSLFLNAQGRIQTAFYLSYLPSLNSEPAFFLDWEEGCPTSPQEWIEYYHFGEQLHYELSPLLPLWLLEDTADSSHCSNPDRFCFALASGEMLLSLEPGWICLWTTDFLKSLNHLRQEGFQLSEGNLIQYDDWRILQGLPRACREITPQAQPLAVGLDSWVASQKGCYPGQEVIEKMRTRQSSPHQLVLLENLTLAPLSAGQAVGLGAEGPWIGSLTSVTSTQQWALACVRSRESQQANEWVTDTGTPLKVIKRR